MWRCPHCGTPQAETARCWVCHRSSTACATCRHFRRSIAAQLGYCGLDRQRGPLRGDEIRGCWEAAEVPSEETPTPIRPSARIAPELVVERTSVRKLEFVEVAASPTQRATTRRVGATRRTSSQTGPDPEADPVSEEALPAGAGLSGGIQPRSGVPAEPRWSLWGDAEG